MIPMAAPKLSALLLANEQFENVATTPTLPSAPTQKKIDFKHNHTQTYKAPHDQCLDYTMIRLPDGITIGTRSTTTH